MQRRFLGICIGLGLLLVAGLFCYGYTLPEEPEVLAGSHPLRLQLALWLGKNPHVVDARGKTALFVFCGQRPQHPPFAQAWS